MSLTELLNKENINTLGVILIKLVNSIYPEDSSVTLTALEEVELNPRLSAFTNIFREPSKDLFATKTKTRYTIPLLKGEIAL